MVAVVELSIVNCSAPFAVNAGVVALNRAVLLLKARDWNVFDCNEPLDMKLLFCWISSLIFSLLLRPRVSVLMLVSARKVPPPVSTMANSSPSASAISSRNVAPSTTIDAVTLSLLKVGSVVSFIFAARVVSVSEAV